MVRKKVQGDPTTKILNSKIGNNIPRSTSLSEAGDYQRQDLDHLLGIIIIVLILSLDVADKSSNSRSMPQGLSHLTIYRSDVRCLCKFEKPLILHIQSRMAPFKEAFMPIWSSLAAKVAYID